MALTNQQENALQDFVSTMINQIAKSHAWQTAQGMSPPPLPAFRTTRLNQAARDLLAYSAHLHGHPDATTKADGDPDLKE